MHGRIFFISLIILSIIFSFSILSCEDTTTGNDDLPQASDLSGERTDEGASEQITEDPVADVPGTQEIPEEIVTGQNPDPLTGEIDAGSSGTAGYTPPVVDIPDGLPFWEGSHMELDLPLIESYAREYCMQYGAEADALDFICGWLPLELADSFCTAAPDKEQMNKLLGAMYVSGYFGGVWLRDILFSNSAETSGEGLPVSIADALKKMMPDVLQAVMESGGEKLIFKNLALLLGTTTATAVNGSRASVLTACGVNAAPFFMVYGYDYGYYYYLIENPPAGTLPGDDPLVCSSFLDCRMESHALETLNRYKPVLDNLLHPTPLYRCLTPECVRWVEMYEAKNVFGLGSVSMGDMVWENIMSDSMMMQGAYGPLVDLSARFMLVSELTILPTVKGYAEYDEDAARCGLLQQAGMMAWLGSYVMGLSSSLPEGTFPCLNCE